MDNASDKKVFISYVHEDTDRIDKFCQLLEAEGIPYWRDRRKINPGQTWKVAIATAIREESMIFLAFFSKSSISRDSGMNEELDVAIEQAKRKQPNATWLIPVRLDEIDIPDYEVRARVSIHDIHRSDLFGDLEVSETMSLLRTIQGLRGATSQSSTDVESMVRNASQDTKPQLLRQKTEELLGDPKNKIQLDNMVGPVAQDVVAHMVSEHQNRFSQDEIEADELDKAMVLRALGHWQAVKPFCATVQAAAAYGDSTNLQPWARGIRSISNAATKTVDGHGVLHGLRHLPLIASIMTAAVAAIEYENWDAFKLLIVDQVTNPPRGERSQIPLLLSTGTFIPFRHSPLAEGVLDVMANEGVNLDEAWKKCQGARRAPRAEYANWLHHELRPLFDRQIPSDDDYDVRFDQAEVMLAMVSLDLAEQFEEPESYSSALRAPTWYGRAIARATGYNPDPIEILGSELDAKGSKWPPIVAGLFGGNRSQANVVLEEYREHFQASVKRKRFEV